MEASDKVKGRTVIGKAVVLTPLQKYPKLARLIVPGYSPSSHSRCRFQTSPKSISGHFSVCDGESLSLRALQRRIHTLLLQLRASNWCGAFDSPAIRVRPTSSGVAESNCLYFKHLEMEILMAPPPSLLL